MSAATSTGQAVVIYSYYECAFQRTRGIPFASDKLRLSGIRRGWIVMDFPEDTEPRPEVELPGGSIAAPLNPQPLGGIKSVPPDPSLWLLALVALMLLAGAVAIYYLTINLDLLFPLCFWLLLATALLGVVARRMIPIVMSPLNNAVRHRPNGKIVTWNHFDSLGSLLLAIILTAVFATGGMFIFALASKPSFYSLYRQFEQPFVLLVTSAVLIALLLFVWLARIRPLQKLLQLRFAGLGVLVICVVIYLALNSWLPSMLANPSDSTGPFASWPAMVQFARHEADRIDKDATIYDVTVYPSPSHGPYSPQTSLFSVEFRFVRPTKEDIAVSLLDTDPIRLEYVNKDTQSLISSYEYAHQRNADWLAYIKLGPRDVYSLTEKEAIAFAQRNRIDVAGFWPSMHITLLFDGAGLSQYGATAVWDMTYISENITKSLDLFVDGATGRALARRSLPDESTATPPPHPSATVSPAP